MEQLNLGVIGCGSIATKAIVPQAASVAEFKLKGFADVVGDRAAEMSSRYGGYHTCETDRVLDDRDIDAVLICTLPDTHAEIAAAAMSRGKHVFIQKPAAVTYDQCRLLVEAEKESQARAMVGYCYRLSPLVQRMRDAVPSPLLIYAHMMSADLMRSRAHYLEIELLKGLGPMLELACHNVDLVYHLAGARPRAVSAFGGNLRHPNADLIDNFSMTIEFENRAIATLLNGDCGVPAFEHKWYTALHGDGVTVLNEGFKALRVRSESGEEVTEFDYNVGIGLSFDMQVFRDVLLGLRPSPTTASDGVIASVLMLKAEEAMKNRRVESVDLAEYGME